MAEIVNIQASNIGDAKRHGANRLLFFIIPLLLPFLLMAYSQNFAEVSIS
jgi:hypothetical protein